MMQFVRRSLSQRNDLENFNKNMVRKEICCIFVEILLIRKRMKSFDTTGHCDPQKHYMLPPEKHWAEAGLSRSIDNITQNKDGVAPNPDSPFNIKEDSIV
jgi:hypothetical protein